MTINLSKLESIALESESAVDFYLSAYQEYGDDLKEFFIDNDTDYKKYYRSIIDSNPRQSSEWKSPTGSLDDWKNLPSMTVNINDFKVIPTTRSSSVTASASSLGVIEVNRSNSFSKEVFDHEIGHQLTNGNPDLQQAVILNYGNALGRYNTRIYKFDGAFGEYNPDEAWATCYSNYINHLSHFQNTFPDAYYAVSNALKKITNLKEIQDGFYKAYEECFGESLK